MSAEHWASPATLALASTGLVLSAYLTVDHYAQGVTLACPATGVINCAKVTTSPQSELVGVPVALLGLLWFAALIPIMLPTAWRRASLAWVRLVAVGSSLPLLAYLIHAETVLHAICLWCTAVHVVTVLLLATTIVATALLEPRLEQSPAG